MEVVLETNGVGIMVALCMVHMVEVYKVGDMMEVGYRKVFGDMRLVSMVVEGYIEEGAHRHMVVVVDNHKEVHHSYWIGMHHRMVLAHNPFRKVVAKKGDQILEAPPIIDCSILDTCSHFSFHLLQYS
ncbi:hypothetical protein AHAS_Ahas11G0240900 [Arachis hypogaea]